jgi:molybdenum cofactor guanylyltransferase
MKISSDDVTGLILAGGRGRRVDEKDKGLLCLQSKPMVEHQLDWFSKQVKKILISANRNIEDYQSYGFPVLEDQNAEENFPGPLEGVLQALQNCTTNWLYVHPVDMPGLPNDVIEKLCQKLKKEENAYFLQSSERSHYLSMLLSIDNLPALRKYLEEGGKRVREFLHRVNAEAVDLGIDEKCFSNLNELTDYLRKEKE